MIINRPTGHKIEKMEIYSVDEVLDLIAKQWIKDFGQLRDDDNDRDGYFMIGFVKAALTPPK